jgi:starch synthase
MACGAAVVASAVGGVPEIVIDGETGLLVPFEPKPDGSPADRPGFAADLAKAINTLVADPERARRMGEAGRRRVVEQFSWAAIAGRTAALYQSLVSSA